MAAGQGRAHGEAADEQGLEVDDQPDPLKNASQRRCFLRRPARDAGLRQAFRLQLGHVRFSAGSFSNRR